MSTSKQQIEAWLKKGNTGENSHMIVMCDTFNWEDYPVYISKKESASDKLEYCRTSSMQKVVEVYSYSIDLEQQLEQPRAFNL